MFSYKRLAILFSLICVVLFNEWNLSTLRSDEIPLRNDTTIITADDPSYLRPMERLYEHGSLYTNETEKWRSIIRSPGYGYLYYGALLLVGKEHALSLLKWMQYLLFAFSVGALYYIAAFLFNSKTWALITALLYGCWPVYYGFLPYTLTEAFSPALFIFTYYFVTKGIRSKKQFKWWIIAGVLGGWLILSRPAMGLFMLPLPIIAVLTYQRKLVPAIGVAFLLALPLVSWQVRHKMVLGSFQSLHPIYINEVPGMYRLPHQSLWNLVKSWEHKSASFHSLTGSFWSAANQNKNPEIAIEAFISELPVNVTESIGRSQWEEYLQLLYTAIQAPQNKNLNSFPLKEEMIAAEKAAELKQLYIQSNWFNYAVATPIKVFRELTFHSNLPYYAVQGKYRGNVIIEIMRWVSLMIYSLGILIILSLPLLWALKCKTTLQQLKTQPQFQIVVALVITSFIYLLYLAFFQRGIEERYTTPILWIGLLGVIYLVRNMIQRFRSFKSNH
ncbi:MAG: glycosyltransferase family 39 protein [Brumimicrobium sp.]